ncbi:MAG: Ig-like domain-containing protein, partial [Flavobacteriaceae bacterium]
MGRLYAQECPSIQSPADGATGVPVDASISWTSVEGVPSYLISIGTTPGGTDIINGFNVGSATQFSPPLGLPQNTQLYVTLTLFFFDRPNIPCPSTTFTTQEVLTPPACTTVATPADGATGVNGATNISWNYTPTATGYRLHIGTTPGGGDILNNADVGNVLTYNPPTDFPPNSQIYVQVTPYNGNGPAIPQCNGSSFTTGDVAVLPNCTQLVSPYNGETNVPLTPFIEWEAVPNADGYRVTIGSSPFASDILDNASFSTNATLVIDFEPNRTFFITIVPFNTAGEAIGCSQEQFSTLVGCGPFYDPDSGELVSLHPEFDFPGTVGICQDSPTVLEAS